MPKIKKRKSVKRERNIRKEDIGVPSNFWHVAHVGRDAPEHFDIGTVDDTGQRPGLSSSSSAEFFPSISQLHDQRRDLLSPKESATSEHNDVSIIVTSGLSFLQINLKM
ncbi:uncharacterized protein LOC124436933 [Xenia sp. Carnegie-2017]|uniref:uncharacterized protein LOC124436933 n=1 Tax=Xenia sp. Carnegie-2017 TaxID=2897299 RepID=UPI001F044356|nr:uncharacterized protein LOC124436933 [Xenia sp. Carnegie-2017]